MLVDAKPVIANRFGKFELVEISVVDLVPTHRVVERARDVDSDRAVFLEKIVGQVGPWHQIEPDEAHWLPPVVYRDTSY